MSPVESPGLIPWTQGIWWQKGSEPHALGSILVRFIRMQIHHCVSKLASYPASSHGDLLLTGMFQTSMETNLFHVLFHILWWLYHHHLAIMFFLLLPLNMFHQPKTKGYLHCCRFQDATIDKLLELVQLAMHTVFVVVTGLVAWESPPCNQSNRQFASPIWGSYPLLLL